MSWNSNPQLFITGVLITGKQARFHGGIVQGFEEPGTRCPEHFDRPGMDVNIEQKGCGLHRSGCVSARSLILLLHVCLEVCVKQSAVQVVGLRGSRLAAGPL